MKEVNELIDLDITRFTKLNHHDSYPAISPTRPELSAKGKHVIVTGGATGIGKAVAIAFAQAGASSVGILGRRENRLQQAVKDINNARSDESTQVLYRSVDITKGEDVTKAITSIAESVGKVTILVASAAVAGSLKLVADLDADVLMEAFETNPISPFTAYTTSKTAGTRLVDHFATEHPEIRVYNLQPGMILTEMNENFVEKGKDTVELPGHFSVWLASPEATFLKGKFVWANFDVNEMKERAEEIENSSLLELGLGGVQAW